MPKILTLTVFNGKEEKQYTWNKKTQEDRKLSNKQIVDLELWETLYINGAAYFLEDV